jgi:lysyl-tRNA synthetase class 2
MSDEERRRLARLKPNLERRARIIELTRRFFTERGFLEADTPIRVPAIAPERYIAPFTSESWFLSISPELHIKRMLASSYDKIFQICHCFRKGERGRWHNPEFTMLEWYRTEADYGDIIEDTEQLISGLSKRFGQGDVIEYAGCKINVEPPWPRIKVKDAFLGAAGWNPIVAFDPVRFDIDTVDKIIPSFSPGRPTVLMDYPREAAALARLSPDGRFAERAEVFIGGLELANIYSELNDPAEQTKRFEEAVRQISTEKGVSMPMPQRFLDAVPHLPRCGGAALGMDRLVMLLCDAGSIDEVIPFTADTA